MRVAAKQYEVDELKSQGLDYEYLTSNIQPFIGFMSAFTTVKPTTTLQDIYDFAKSREAEAIEYIKRWYVKLK